MWSHRLNSRLSSYEYRCLVDQAPVLLWRSGPDGLCDFFNLQWLAFRGRTLEEETGDGWLAGIHPADAVVDECRRNDEG